MRGLSDGGGSAYARRRVGSEARGPRSATGSAVPLPSVAAQAGRAVHLPLKGEGVSHVALGFGVRPELGLDVPLSLGERGQG